MNVLLAFLIGIVVAVIVYVVCTMIPFIAATGWVAPVLAIVLGLIAGILAYKRA